MNGRERFPDPRAPGVAVGVTETMVHELVHEFYARIRKDETLGPIFNAEIRDWPKHLDTMCAFWSSVALMTGRYKGNPMAMHSRLPGLTRALFERWLTLFRETTADVCTPGAAEFFVLRSERIAQSLQMGIALHRGQSLLEPLG